MYVAAVLAQGVYMLGFSDEEVDALAALATALPPRGRRAGHCARAPR
jgi:hypothetical protein